MPVSLSVAEILFLAILSVTYNWNVVFQILQRHVELQVVGLLRSGRHRICIWVVQRSESLVHRLRRRSNRVKARKPLLLLLLRHMLMMLFG